MEGTSVNLFKKLFTVLEPVLANGADSVFQVLKEEGLKSAGERYSLTEEETTQYLKEVETSRKRRDNIENSVNTQLTRKRVSTPKAPVAPKAPRTPRSPTTPASKPRTTTKRKPAIQPSFEDLFGVPASDEAEHDNLLDFLDLDGDD